jgi:hypothetical protein
MYRAAVMPRPKHYKLPRIPKAKRRGVTRAEYNGLVELLNERGQMIASINKTLDLQFQRIAQLQAELDHIRMAWTMKRQTRPSSF